MANEFKLTTVDNKEIPLQSVNYIITICNANCDVTIDQVYKNTESVPIEVLYVFPSIAGISIHYFEADINGKIVKTQIKEKEEAVKNYNDAIKEGNQAFLMEKLDGDTFSVCLGNIPANSDVKIKISGCLDLVTEINATKLRLCVPSTIMKKYTSKNNPTFLGSVLDNVDRISNKPYNMKITGSILMSDGLESINSKTHPIQILNMRQNQADFEIVPEQLDSDIILTITRKTPKTLILSSCADNVPPEFKYASQVNIIPDFSLVPECSIVDTSYIIILDSSGSMQGEDFNNCVNSGIMFVASLPIGSKFNVYNFASTFNKFQNELITATPESKENATKWINKINCGGGTEVLSVLKDAYGTLKESNSVIVFLSDGGVDNTDQVIRLVKENNHIGVYTIGIGQNVSQTLITQMAEQSVGGVAEFINNSNDQLEEKVLAQLNRAQQKLRKCQKNNNIRVDTNGAYTMIPEIKYLYEGDVNTFYIFSEKPIDSVCYNQCGGNNDIWAMTVVHPNNYESENNLIHKLSGIKLLNELYTAENIVSNIGTKIPHLNSQNVGLEKKTNKDRIIAVSKGLNILSKYTAFIGVEVIQNKNGTEQTAILKQIPLQQTKKYNGYDERMYDNVSLKCCSASLGAVSRSASSARSKGVNTVGSSHKNATYDLRSVPKSAKSIPWSMSDNSNNKSMESCKMGFDSEDSDENEDTLTQSLHMENKCESVVTSSGFFSGALNYMSSMFGSNDTVTISNTSKTILSKPNVLVKYVVKIKLPEYNILGTILTSKQNGVLPFIEKVNVDDYVELTMESGHDGIYKVIQLGSKFSPWVLKKY